MEKLIEGLNKELFEKTLFLNDNEFLILPSSDIVYEDFNYQSSSNSIIYVQLKDANYLFKLFREIDQCIVAEINLRLNKDTIYLLNHNVKANFKSANNTKIQKQKEIKSLILFFLTYINAHSKEVIFSYISKES